jgi:hypothetical protein
MRRRGDVPKMGQKGWFPDHTAERRGELARTTAGERVAEAIELSRTATRVAAAAAHRQRER